MKEPIMLFPQLVNMKPIPRLIGSKCPVCNLFYFPFRVVCPQCFLEGLDECLLTIHGRIKGFTIVRAKQPKGFPLPYAVGYVELIKEGLVIPSLLTADSLSSLCVGAHVELVIEFLSDNEEGRNILVYKFRVKE